MAHVHDEPGQIDFTVTAYILRNDGDGDGDGLRALVHMHRKQRMLMPVGGHIELTETPWAAAEHEIAEEAGYAFSQLSVYQPKLRVGLYERVVVHPQPLFMNTHDISETHWHTDIAYLFLATGEPELMVDEQESQDIRWMTRAEIAALDRTAMYENVQGTYLAAFDTFASQWEPVPATDFETGRKQS